MKTIHFFKAHSRLGLINFPIHATEYDIGVENGPDAVLTQNFLNKITPTPKMSSYTFSLPEKIKKEEYYNIIAHESQEFAGMINKIIAKDIQVTVGGDHSIGLPTLMAVMERFESSKVGHIQFDSHGDLHKVSTSPSGNFHGMWLRPFVGDFDNEAVQSIVPSHLSPQQILFVGNLELEDEEMRLMEQNQIANISGAKLSDSVNDCLQIIKSFVQKYEHIHVSFDIDVFHRSLVAATGTPSLKGLLKEQVFALLKTIKDSANDISIDLVEVNPQKPTASQTIATAQEVLMTLLK